MSGSSTETKLRFRGSSEDGSSCSTAGGRDFCDDTLMPESIINIFLFYYSYVAYLYFVFIFKVHSPIPPSLTTITAAATAATISSATTTTTTTHTTANYANTSTNASASITGSTTTGVGGSATGDIDTESYSSSVDSSNEDDRVYLQIGETLKSYLEYDWTMITKSDKLVNLPAKVPVITILENFVKHYSIKAISCPTQIDTPRRRNSSAKIEKREKDYEKLSNRYVVLIMYFNHFTINSNFHAQYKFTKRSC